MRLLPSLISTLKSLQRSSYRIRNLNISLISDPIVMTIPTLPSQVLNAFGKQLVIMLNDELSELQRETLNDDESNDVVYKQSRFLMQKNANILFNLRTGNMVNMDTILKENTDSCVKMLSSIGNNCSRRQRVSYAIEKFTEVRLLYSFFLTGTLTRHSEMEPCNDEEYIGGILGFAHELARYAVGRACEGDIKSIELCHSLVLDVNGKMLEFNFRNGPLRRKYDALKYALKSLENLIFEVKMMESKRVAFSGTDGGLGQGQTDGESACKRLKISSEDEEIIAIAADTENETRHAPAISDIEAIRLRMEVYDALREDVIKKTRDVQKLSKQGIYSVQRGGLVQAADQLKKGEELLGPILDIVAENPNLRQGAVSNSLEEWAEGKLILEWASNSRIMSKAEMKIVDSDEYVGALSDFTGEIGRMAVAAASRRDVEAVDRILQADMVIAAAITQLNVGGKYAKKGDAINMNLKKVEDIMYELSMLRQGGLGMGRVTRLREPEPPVVRAKDEAEYDEG